MNLYALAVIPVLGTMIIFHELGHFLAAKLFKVRVEAFSIGFGKRLFGFIHGGTDYKVCALPLGGYVKMAGDSLGDGSGDPAEFLAKPRWQRFIIALMGPIFNVILAVGLLTILFSFKYQEPSAFVEPFRVGEVRIDSAAAKAGLRTGDLITRFDGLADPAWEAIQIRAAANPGAPLAVTYRRGDQTLNTTLTPDTEAKSKVGDAGWSPYFRTMVFEVNPGLPADLAGLKVGDQITAIDGQPLSSFEEVTPTIVKSNGKPLVFTVQRAGKSLDLTVTPAFREATGDNAKRWRIGVTVRTDSVTRDLNLGQAFDASVKQNEVFAGMIFDFLGKLVERKMSPQSLGGVIEITKQTGEAAKHGPADLLLIMAMISINLAIFNLLPIPILDGGVILLLLIEGTLRRDLSLALKEKIITVGFVFLVLFAVYVTYMDIIRSLPVRFEKFLP